MGKQLLPKWFTALGNAPADTDGDGFSDCWERWTRTNRAVADDGLAPDGDGVDNFGEFWNQCDPMMADTDGDGFSDYVEIAGQAAGKAWYDHITLWRDGGRTVPENCQMLCRDCNRRKGAK